MKIQEADYNEVLKLRHEVMYPNESIELAKVENDDRGIHVGVFLDEGLVSCVSIFLEERSLQFRKLATKDGFRKQGHASNLVKYVIDFYNQFQFDRLWANARLEALPFYESFGFKATDQTFVKNGIEYVVIEYAAPPKFLS